MDSSGDALVALSGCQVVRPAVPDGIELVIAEPAMRAFPLRVSETFGICFKRGRAHAVHSDGRALLYPADAVCVRQPGCVWSCEATAVGFVSIDFDSALLPGGLRPAPMRFVDPAKVPRLADVLEAFEPGAETFRREELIAVLFDSLLAAGALDAEELRSAPTARVIARVRELFDAHPEENPRLSELARKIGVNRFTLIRSFRRMLGTTPHAYLVRLRVARAERLLAEGLSPGEVALRCGFADQAHLSRHFRRVVGVPPGRYARQVRSSVLVRLPA